MIPVQAKITSRFGKRKHPFTGAESFHNGVDISCKEGTPVLAPDFGIIMKLWSHPQGGLCMAMKSTEGIRFGFAHLSKRLVREGQPVVQGQRIALTGNTGRSTGPHLHFTVQDLGMWVDPLKYFDWRKLFCVLVLMLILPGCCTLRKLNKDCNITKDSITSHANTVTVYRDTIVAVKLKGDSTDKILPVFIDSDRLPFSGVSELESPLSRSVAWVSEGKLNHTLLQKDTILNQKLQNGIKNTTVTTDKKEVTSLTQVINEPTKWQWFQIYLGRAIFCLLIIAYIGIRLKNRIHNS